MKVNNRIEAIGYRHLTKEEAKKNPWPPWLKKGIHRVSKVKNNGFGKLIQTDRQPKWMNSDWFRLTL